MKRPGRWLLGSSALLLTFLTAPLVRGLAISGGAVARIRADAARFSATGFGTDDLPSGWKRILLAVEDPAFERHRGVDLRTPGAGLTTITQSIAKRYCFDRFAPGFFAKLVQTGCAVGNDRRISKTDQLTVALHTAGLGPGASGWVDGFPAAAREYFDKEPQSITTREFTTLVAMMIGPSRYHPRRGPALLEERVHRIERLLAGECRPAGLRDVTLEACR